MFTEFDRRMYKRIFLPLLMLLAAMIAYTRYYYHLNFGMLSFQIERINKWIFAFFAFFVGCLIQGVIDAALDWYGANISKKTVTELDDEFLPLGKKVLDFLLWIMVMLVILARFGIDTKGIIAALGVGSIAIALAAQDTISNIIAGFLLVVDRPFRISDRIQLPSGEKVKVIAIGLRRSKFLNDDGSIVIVPNLDLSRSKIVNYTYGEKRNKGNGG